MRAAGTGLPAAPATPRARRALAAGTALVALAAAAGYGINAIASRPAPVVRPLAVQTAACARAHFGPVLRPLGAPPSLHRYRRAPAMTIDVARLYQATIAGPAGRFSVCLVPGWAPHTVNVFVTLARNRFFDGLRWVRDPTTAPGGPVIQGGSPTDTASGGPGFAFPDETVRGPLYGHGHYLPGAVAMANSGPNTNGSQFFVTLRPFTLPPSYNLFGTVTQGLAVARRVRKGQRMTVTVREARS
ncbi:MAG TPA: peptidylprolyl isomerase [Candidatus Micrarchaeia archaeon]|nr:peptidylprolyl isomerase [Candidatus Micrarchaeia archaeon]